MAVDKPLTPLEIADIEQRVSNAAEDALVIDIENPDSVTIETEDGGAIIDFDPEGEEEEIPFDANLAEYLDERTLNALGSELVGAFDDDKESRRDWEEAYIKGLEQLGLKVRSLYALARSLWSTPPLAFRGCCSLSISGNYRNISRIRPCKNTYLWQDHKGS